MKALAVCGEVEDEQSELPRSGAGVQTEAVSLMDAPLNETWGFNRWNSFTLFFTSLLFHNTVCPPTKKQMFTSYATAYRRITKSLRLSECTLYYWMA